MNLSRLFTCYCSLLVVTHCTDPDYYWRDYYGEIPRDAVPGGLDKNNHVTYIGQVFIPGHGLFPIGIYPGKTAVNACIGGQVFTSDVYVKILCSQHTEGFEWFPVTSTNLHTVSIGKTLVLGGSESNKALNIGRIFYQNQIVVGKVPSYILGDARFYFCYGTSEKMAQTYQVLVHNATLTRLVIAP